MRNYAGDVFMWDKLCSCGEVHTDVFNFKQNLGVREDFWCWDLVFSLLVIVQPAGKRLYWKQKRKTESTEVKPLKSDATVNYCKRQFEPIFASIVASQTVSNDRREGKKEVLAHKLNKSATQEALKDLPLPRGAAWSSDDNWPALRSSWLKWWVCEMYSFIWSWQCKARVWCGRVKRVDIGPASTWCKVS